MNGTIRTKFRWVLAVLAVAALVAACGGGGSSGGDEEAASSSGPVPEPKDPVTITFASWVGNQKGMKRLYKKFHHEHPKITVKFQNVPAERIQQKLTTELAGGNAPDVAYIDASDVAAFASREALLNLDDYIARSKVVSADGYMDAFRTFVTYKHSMYGLPFDGESTGLFYRTDKFKAAGISHPPTTWAEFTEDAKALTRPGKKQYGFQIFAPEAAYYWYPWLWQAGGKLLSQDQKTVLFDSAAAKRAAKFYIGLKKYSSPDYLNANSYDGRVGFGNGQVAMYIAGAWFAGTLEDEFPKLDGKWTAAPLPEGKDGCATTIAGDALVQFAGSEHQDAAWKWIEFLSKPDNVATWTYKAEGTLLPPLKSLVNSPDLAKEKPVLKEFAKQMKCGVANVVANPKWPQIQDALNTQLGRAIYGDTTPAKALDSAAEKARTILSQ